MVAIDVRQLTQAARVRFATFNTHRACQCIANTSVYHCGEASLQLERWAASLRVGVLPVLGSDGQDERWAFPRL